MLALNLSFCLSSSPTLLPSPFSYECLHESHKFEILLFLTSSLAKFKSASQPPFPCLLMPWKPTMATKSLLNSLLEHMYTVDPWRTRVWNLCIHLYLIWAVEGSAAGRESVYVGDLLKSCGCRLHGQPMPLTPCCSKVSCVIHSSPNVSTGQTLCMDDQSLP